MSRPLVFVTAYVSWQAMVERGGNFAQDRMARRLVDDDELGPVVIAEPFRSVASPVKDLVTRRDRAPFVSREDRLRFSPVRVRRADPTDVAAVRRSYGRYSQLLGLWLRARGISGAEVLTTHPLVAGFAPMPWASKVTFFATDDWTASHRRVDYLPAYRAAFTTFGASGRDLAAVSQPIVDRIEPTGRAIVVPNGLEASEWDPLPPAPEWLTALPGRKLAYVGTLDSRLDTDAIEALVRDMPDVSIVLMGPKGHGDAAERLSRLPGVHVRPSVRRGEVAGVLGGVDACLIPHRRTPLTEAMSPLKLYEYLAAGRPVVATDLAPMRGVSDRVTFAAEPATWRPAVEQALALPRQADAERLAFVSANSWRSRQDRILELTHRQGGPR